MYLGILDIMRIYHSQDLRIILILNLLNSTYDSEIMTGKMESTPGLIGNNTGMINQDTGLINDNTRMINDTNDTEYLQVEEENEARKEARTTSPETIHYTQ